MAGAAALIYTTQLEWRWRRTVWRQVTIPDLPPALDGLRILHLSDTHIGGLHNGAPHVRAARRLPADLVLVTGDLAEGNGAIAETARLLGALDAPLGTWAVLGNHDYPYPKTPIDTTALVAALEERGVRVLRNSAARLCWRGQPFWLAGTDDPHRRRDDLAATLADVPPGAPTLLLTHSPDGLADLAPGRVLLALVGHTHGGQVRLPGLRPLTNTRLRCPHPRGLQWLNGTLTHFHVGIGNLIPFRFGVRPELVVLTLRRL